MSIKMLSLIEKVFSHKIVETRTIILLVFIAIFPIGAWGDITVDLPSLETEIQSGDGASDSFNVGTITPGTIEGASIHIEGTHTKGRGHKWDDPFETMDLNGTLIISMFEPEDGLWQIQKTITSSGSFSFDAEFNWFGTGEPDWSFLEDGATTVSVGLSYNIPLSFEVDWEPVVNIWQARLTITVDWTEPVRPPAVDPKSATNVGPSSATLRGAITDDGADDGTAACDYRFRYRKAGDSNTYTSWSGTVTQGEIFEKYVSGLSQDSVYYFSVQARNDAGSSAWSSELDFTTTTGYPDLSDDGEEWRSFSPHTIEGDETLEISCDIQNEGNADAGSFEVCFYASVDTSIYSSDYYIGSLEIPGIVKDGYYDCDWSGNFPINIPSGQYYVGWIIDADDEISESDEGNNTAYKAGYKLTVINGNEHSITVKSPNGGEQWERGRSYNITWEYDGDVGNNVKIELHKGGSLNRTIVVSTPNDGSHGWPVPSDQTLGSDYKIKITSTYNSSYNDYSDSNFSIVDYVQPYITVTNPKGGETWWAGTSHDITWDCVGDVGPHVKIQLYQGDEFIIPSIEDMIAADEGTFRWTVPSSLYKNTNYKIKITSTRKGYIFGYSGEFTIPNGKDPWITLTSPNGGEQWRAGTSHNITWDYGGDVGNSVKLQLYKGGVLLRPIYDTIPTSDRAYNWIISPDLPPGSDYKVKITSIPKPSYYDYSDNNFTIPGIAVTSPKGGEQWQAGSSENITWTSIGNVGPNVRIDLYKSDVLDSPIADSTDNNGAFAWPIPEDQTAGPDYKIKITSTANPVFFDDCNVFSITAPDIPVAFEDTFPSTTIDPTKWTRVVYANVDGMGINEPSLSYSLRLNGYPSGGDLIESAAIDLSPYSDANLEYYYQHTGGGNPPRAGEDLIVDYFDGSGWFELDRRLGSGSTMTSYELRNIALPPEAMHANFKLRIRRGEGTHGPYGDWFVDDVRIEVSDDNGYPVKLVASDGEPGDLFGQAVSISGEYAIVGASEDDNCGSAYIFERSSTGWVQQPRLTAPSPERGDYFGCDVSICGDYAGVGVYGDDYNGTDSGSAYIFKRTDQGWFMHVAGVHPRDGADHDRFGCAVSISGDYLIVGSYWDDDNGTDSGSSYVIQYNATSWLERSKLRALDAAKRDCFGCSVSISGDYAIVGANLHDDSESDCGAAYIFKRDNTNWIQKTKILALDREGGDEFGGSVSISGNYAVIGAICDDDVGEDSGAAYIFERNGENWTQRAKLTPSDADAGGDHFGNSVSIDGDYVVVGASLDDDLGEDSGAAYIYKREGLSWNLQAKLTAPDGDEGDLFGQGVSISGSYVIVSAPNDDDNGDNSGSVYIFKRNGAIWKR